MVGVKLSSYLQFIFYKKKRKKKPGENFQDFKNNGQNHPNNSWTFKKNPLKVSFFFS